MKFNIHGKKIDVTDSIKSYIEEKIGRLDKYFENPDDVITTAVIKLRGKDQQVVEIMIKKIFMKVLLLVLKEDILKQTVIGLETGLKDT